MIASVAGSVVPPALPHRGDAIERLLEVVVAIKRQQLHEHGDVDSSFQSHDTAFCWSAGRLQFSHPLAVLQLEQQLKLARKAVEANGSAVRRHGRPFWTIKLPAD